MNGSRRTPPSAKNGFGSGFSYDDNFIRSLGAPQGVQTFETVKIPSCYTRCNQVSRQKESKQHSQSADA
jgi:hypothetical protein